MVPVRPTARLGSAPPDCGQWVIPEWERVADECDVAHFTIQVYLSSATCALQVDPTRHRSSQDGTPKVLSGSRTPPSNRQANDRHGTCAPHENMLTVRP